MPGSTSRPMVAWRSGRSSVNWRPRGWAASSRCRVYANVIVDDVFLGGSNSQQRWTEAIGDVEVLWVGVRCDAETAAGREIARGDRVGGMAALQAEVVHRGVKYDVEVDTAHTESIACARAIANHLN